MKVPLVKLCCLPPRRPPRLILFLTLAVAAALSSVANPVPKTTTKAQAEAIPAAADFVPTGEVAQTLVLSQDRLVSTNLVQPSREERKVQADNILKERFESARKQREMKLFKECRVSLSGIMSAEAPEEIWRASMLELALLAQDEGDLTQAQQVYAQYLSRWPDDVNVPEILLRQGLLYRQMGLSQVAISKFYAVMTSALVVKGDRLEHYQKLVLQAQSEIAETYYLAGKYGPARDSFTKILKQGSQNLNRAQVQVKLVRCLGELKIWEELVVRGQDLLQRFPQAPEGPEVRFLMAGALKQLGRKEESLRQVQLLLKEEAGSQNAEALGYWKQRAGNDIANQFYKEGEFLKALDIYVTLASLNDKPTWQCPVLYQVGLIYERLAQPARAVEYYQKVLNREKDVGPDALSSLQAVFDLARWRSRFLTWEVQAEAAQKDLIDPPEDLPLPEPNAKPSS